MERETVLKLSREENKHKYDECEIAAIDFSYEISRLVGGILCAILACLGAFVFEAKELSMGVSAIYFAMFSSSNIVRFVKMQRKSDLAWSIIDTLITITSLVLLFVWLV